MIYPPEPIDPKKDLWSEIKRFAREHARYHEAMRTGENLHGPWQQEASDEETTLLRYIPPPPYDHFTSEHYWNDRRWYDDSRW